MIASMIERETVAPEERRLVSAVIYNRLERDMALGIDATLRYGPAFPPTGR
jgi:cell division protein YceG involved in septum cleavage